MGKIEDITKQLEQGIQDIYTSDRYAAYLDCMSKFYRYSASNCILILMQCPTASRIAGFKAWKDKFNRSVRKGEKAIRILAPCPHKRTVKDPDGEEQEITYTTFRPVSVFDISQTEGPDLPDICSDLTGTVSGYADLIRTLESISPVPVQYKDIQSAVHGYFSHAEKIIAIKTGMSEMQTVKTLIHEIAHSILHDKESGEKKEADRNTKEVQAESVAYTVCKYIGMETSDYSFGYIAGWSAGKEAKELKNSLDIIQKTARQIIEKITQ